MKEKSMKEQRLEGRIQRKEKWKERRKDVRR